jgi:ATP-dependent DNA helicase RecG
VTKSTLIHAASSVTVLKGIGAQLASKLEKLGISTLQDLLFHLPRQYADRTRITPIGSLQPNQSVVIEGEIQGTDVVFGKRRSLVCRLQDNTGRISLRFYHFSHGQRANLATGATIRCYGETRRGASGVELYHPEYQLFTERTGLHDLEQTLTPIYSITDGITQTRLRSIIKQALTYSKSFDFPHLIPDDEILHGLSITLIEALEYLHAPPKDADLHQLLEGQHPYQQTLIMEELTAYQVSLLQLREKRRQQQGLALATHHDLRDTFTQSLAFDLTSAQTRVSQEIEQDLQQAIPMMRLLQGDVGAGKTVIAALAALQAIANGYQVAIMAPTEILTEQHRLNFEAWFSPLNIHVGFLTGKQKVSMRRQQLHAIETGEAQLVIGTHALFQEDVVFHHLALVIIDEQHRFGVHQRLSLRNKGAAEQGIPHQLIMTATPIPRTLAMSAYADLDYSVVDELPKGRIPVETVVISQQRRDSIIERIHHACQEGRQAYWVCTLIEQSETLEAQAAEATADMLTLALPEQSIGLIHGRLKAQEKDAIMTRFKAGEIDLLVATTVIEVGVDVPNASLMIIENPERLGLAQLHQLRGRVGRGSTASHCVLLYGDALSLQGKERLQAMRSTCDGFKIAEIDLSLRGPGEVLGTRQTGDIDFTLADLRRDLALMPQVTQYAEALLCHHPDKTQAIIQRWLGNKENYAGA